MLSLLHEHPRHAAATTRARREDVALRQGDLLTAAAVKSVPEPRNGAWMTGCASNRHGSVTLLDDAAHLRQRLVVVPPARKFAGSCERERANAQPLTSYRVMVLGLMVRA